MADQMIGMALEPVIPNALTAGERAILLNIEAHSNWSNSAALTALLKRGLITRRSGGQFVLTDQGRTTLVGLLQDYRRIAESARQRLLTGRFRAELRD